MVDHVFLFKSLEHFGFGERFVSVIKIIYKDMNGSVSLQRFPISRGIRQGCPLCPLLSISAANMLSF